VWIRTRIAVQGAGLPGKLESIQTKCALINVDNMWFVIWGMGAAPEAVVANEVSGVAIMLVCIQIKENG